jgi:dihydropteroate synthase type 2
LSVASPSDTLKQSAAETPQIVGILNITEDSFSDGGAYLDPDAALAQAQHLVADGATMLDIGPASSHPDASHVPPETEIARLQAVWPELQKLGVPLAVDSFQPETQIWAMQNGADWLNDINGFPNPALYDDLAASACYLVVMHAIQAKGIATRANAPDGDIWDIILRFFSTRLAALEAAGIARERLVLDPGMGFFLGNSPEASLQVLANIDRLKQAFGLPVYICASRKSFLRALADVPVGQTGSVTLAAELWAAAQGVDYIRTHAPKPLCEALVVHKALAAAKVTY